MNQIKGLQIKNENLTSENKTLKENLSSLELSLTEFVKKYQNLRENYINLQNELIKEEFLGDPKNLYKALLQRVKDLINVEKNYNSIFGEVQNMNDDKKELYKKIEDYENTIHELEKKIRFLEKEKTFNSHEIKIYQEKLDNFHEINLSEKEKKKYEYENLQSMVNYN